MSAHLCLYTDATHPTRCVPALVNARAKGPRGVRGVASVGRVDSWTESDDMRRGLLAFAAVSVLGCLYGTGVIQARTVQITAAALAVALAAGVAYGALVGAGHAQERRAWQDYRHQRALVPVARRAWVTALGTSARRLVGPAVLAGVVALLWWRGSR